MTTESLTTPSYDELVAAAEETGLYKRTLWRYGFLAVLLVCGYGASLYFLTVSDSIPLQALNAIFFGFLTVQWGALGHDLSHKQIFASDRLNAIFGTIAWGLFAGLSQEKWYERHNAHHKHPNRVGDDPDIDIPFCFSERQRSSRTNFLDRLFRSHQHIIFFIVLPAVYPSYLRASFDHIFSRMDMTRVSELLLVAVHFFVIFFILFSSLPVAVAMLFLGIAIATTGIYMGLIFAPNHKGQDILSAEDPFLWTHQITLSRNLGPSRLVTYLFGGLNFQIEHHVFTCVSRFKFRQARDVVKAYCVAHGIPHEEKTVFGSMREIYGALKREASVQSLSQPFSQRVS